MKETSVRRPKTSVRFFTGNVRQNVRQNVKQRKHADSTHSQGAASVIRSRQTRTRGETERTIIWRKKEAANRTDAKQVKCQTWRCIAQLNTRGLRIRRKPAAYIYRIPIITFHAVPALTHKKKAFLFFFTTEKYPSRCANLYTTPFTPLQLFRLFLVIQLFH